MEIEKEFVISIPNDDFEDITTTYKLIDYVVNFPTKIEIKL